MKKIEIHNFRCFENLELELNSGVNLLIGDNASGKTTILRALRAAMSSFFAGYSDENTRFTGLKIDDFTQTIVNDSKAVFKPIKIEFVNSDYIEYPELQNNHLFKDVPIFIALAGPKARTQITGIKEFKHYTKKLQDSMFSLGPENKQVKSLPLFASFTTEDIHSIRKINANIFKDYFHKPSFGYYECLDGNGFLPYWIKRLIVLEEGLKSLSEVEAVRNAIIKALGVDGCNIISNMIVRPKQGKVYYIFTDGREVEAANLSDGYARLVNIVTDLSFRCMLLNKGIYGLEACSKTIGTVLIDEIDLHLHPTLQSVVIKGLQIAFPKLQFIITTHAPMVMTSIQSDEENVIYKLSYKKEKGYEVNSIDLYGMDASTIIGVALDTIPRSKEVDDELTKLFNFIDDDKYDEARELLHDMKSRFRDSLPELIKAETMLNFLVDSDD